MLLRRYGTTVQSVVTNFDPRAMTEISFRRDRQFSMPVEAFEAEYEKVREESIEGESEGPVQSEAEAELLDELEKRLGELEEGLEEEEALFIESQQGVDHPKLRDRKQGIIVEGENRLYFHWWVEPPLRVGIYRRRSQ